MTTKHLSGYYGSGYTLAAGYSKLVIDKTADIRGDGVSVPFFATVVNQGSVYGYDQGVYLEAGGSLINGSAKNTSASISSDSLGVLAPGGAAIANFGTIADKGQYGRGVLLQAGGSVTNGSIHDTTALIFGYDGVDGAATVANFGTIDGRSSDFGQVVAGVVLGADGSLTNGSAGDTAALILGNDGVIAFAATIANFGTIRADGDYGAGVTLNGGGSVTNGSAHDTTAFIYGEYGVNANGVTTVTNFGTIGGGGVELSGGGTITNGSAVDTGAYISGIFTGFAAAATIANFGVIGGVDLAGGGLLTNGSVDDAAALIIGGTASSVVATVVNFGTIEAGNYGGDKYGVELDEGGTITNGLAAHTDALISGVEAKGAATVTNFGAIKSGYYSYGVRLEAGGAVTNGSALDPTALIIGRGGVRAEGAAAAVANTGTIGAGGDYGVGVDLEAGGSVANGSANDSTALIYGDYGVIGSGAVSIVNYGTIKGFHGVSVILVDAGDEVTAEAGSTFIGTIEGGYGTLALAGGGTGTISSLGAGGTLTGAVEAEFIHFDQVVIEAGGAWTLAGTNKVDQSARLVDEGTLNNSGGLTISGTLSIAASAVFRLAGGDILAGPTGDADIVDYGLMIKSPGRGTITVGAHMFDRGVVEVASGTLDFTSRLYGTGVMKIDAGATLEADAGAVSTLTVTFDGAAATLALKTPKTFAATLSGFAAGDIIDLLAIKATGASVNGGDQLVIVNGVRTVASLQLSGNYAGATFSTASDGHGGTSVTLTSGGPDLPSVAGMVSAMAAVAAPPGVATLGHDLRAERTLVLARPNVHLQ
jgi:fibronectin-binding autotransporter adhesin